MEPRNLDKVLIQKWKEYNSNYYNSQTEKCGYWYIFSAYITTIYGPKSQHLRDKIWVELDEICPLSYIIL